MWRTIFVCIQTIRTENNPTTPTSETIEFIRPRRPVFLYMIIAAVPLLAVSLLLLKPDRGKKEPKESDSEKFLKKIEHFSVLEELAIDAMHPSDNMTKEDFLKALKKTALNDWVECVNLMDEAENFELPPGLVELRGDIKTYSSRRIEETQLYIRSNEEGTNKYNKQIDSLQLEIQSLAEKIRENRPVMKEGPVLGL